MGTAYSKRFRKQLRIRLRLLYQYFLSLSREGKGTGKKWFEHNGKSKHYHAPSWVIFRKENNPDVGMGRQQRGKESVEKQIEAVSEGPILLCSRYSQKIRYQE